MDEFGGWDCSRGSIKAEAEPYNYLLLKAKKNEKTDGSVRIGRKPELTAVRMSGVNKKWIDVVQT